MKTIENSIRGIGIFVIILVFVYTHFIIPTYPTISSNYSVKKIQQFVDRVLKNEARNYSFEALDNGANSSSTELIDAVRKLDINLKDCKNDKQCLIETYEAFMDDWVSDTTKAQTRYLYMDSLGFIGKQINSALDWSY